MLPGIAHVIGRFRVAPRAMPAPSEVGATPIVLDSIALNMYVAVSDSTSFQDPQTSAFLETFQRMQPSIAENITDLPSANGIIEPRSVLGMWTVKCGSPFIVTTEGLACAIIVFSLIKFMNALLLEITRIGTHNDAYTKALCQWLSADVIAPALQSLKQASSQM